MNLFFLSVNIFILLVLSILHFSWALGFQWGFDGALPRRENGERLFTPRKMDSFIVGLGLLLMGSYYLIWGNIISVDLPIWITRSGIWIISIIFLLRAMGDFRYVGFFKKVKSSTFAQLDSRWYSPLCLWLGASGMALIYLT